jgi:hypothetical protein
MKTENSPNDKPIDNPMRLELTSDKTPITPYSGTSEGEYFSKDWNGLKGYEPERYNGTSEAAYLRS